MFLFNLDLSPAKIWNNQWGRAQESACNNHGHTKRKVDLAAINLKLVYLVLRGMEGLQWLVKAPLLMLQCPRLADSGRGSHRPPQRAKVREQGGGCWELEGRVVGMRQPYVETSKKTRNMHTNGIFWLDCNSSYENGNVNKEMGTKCPLGIIKCPDFLNIYLVTFHKHGWDQ